MFNVNYQIIEKEGQNNYNLILNSLYSSSILNVESRKSKMDKKEFENFKENINKIVDFVYRFTIHEIYVQKPLNFCERVIGKVEELDKEKIIENIEEKKPFKFDIGETIIFLENDFAREFAKIGNIVKKYVSDDGENYYEIDNWKSKIHEDGMCKFFPEYNLSSGTGIIYNNRYGTINYKNKIENNKLFYEIEMWDNDEDYEYLSIDQFEIAKEINYKNMDDKYVQRISDNIYGIILYKIIQLEKFIVSIDRYSKILSPDEFKYISIKPDDDKNIKTDDFIKVNDSFKYANRYGIIRCDNFIKYNNGLRKHVHIDFGNASHSYDPMHVNKINYKEK